MALILHLHRTLLRMTGAAIAATLGLARSTVARWLRHGGLGRLARIDPSEPVRRYQRQRPGELIHPDIKKLCRFDQPGHRVTGTWAGCSNRGAGWDLLHIAVGDATRLACVEVLGDERRDTTAGFLLRALRWFRAQVIGARAGDARQRKRLPLAPLRPGDAVAEHPPHFHKTLHPQDQRQGRALAAAPNRLRRGARHSNSAVRMGLWPLPPLIWRKQRRPAAMA